jgi:hypothetical protein
MTTATKDIKVFIAGSRHLSKLNQEVKRRIDKIVEKHLTIMIGDANGVDKAVQLYLNAKGYPNVLVFCMHGSCRNNIGNWATQEIKAADPRRRDFAYYSTKDRAMAREADYGFMLWDGESRGTLTSIVQLVRESKPVVLFLAPEKAFYTLRDSDDLAKVHLHVDEDNLNRIDRDLQTGIADRNPNKKQSPLPLLF